MLNFPEDLIWEILSRLPVKSVLRFRCVSKSWRSLISTKCFISLHLKRNLARKMFISIAWEPSSRLINCPLQSLLCGSAVEFEYPIHSPQYSVRVVGCCNGIACISISGKQLFLWNPSTRKFKKIPNADDDRANYEFGFGFGFDELSNDYKIVRILRYEISDDTDRVKVYSLRSNSWKVINDASKDSFSIRGVAGKLVNGKLHWLKLCYSDHDLEWYEVVSFDLGSETCASIELPHNFEVGCFLQLGVLEECLCMVRNKEIWILKQCWEKKVATIRCPYCIYIFPCLMLLCMGPKGEIFLFYKSTFMVYDPKDCSYKCSNIRNLDGVFDAQVYSESLVSLGEGESDARLEALVGLMAG